MLGLSLRDIAFDQSEKLKVNIHLLWLLQNLLMRFSLNSRVHLSTNFEKNINLHVPTVKSGYFLLLPNGICCSFQNFIIITLNQKRCDEKFATAHCTYLNTKAILKVHYHYMHFIHKHQSLINLLIGEVLYQLRYFNNMFIIILQSQLIPVCCISVFFPFCACLVWPHGNCFTCDDSSLLRSS